MPQNIELKIKVDDFSKIFNILQNNGTQISDILYQRDVYFKNSNGLLKLRIFDKKGELIFYQRDEFAKDRVSNYYILELNPNESEDFFRKAFEVEVEVIKKRTLLLYKNTRIHLDEVENLGNYLELETVVKDSTEKGIEEFNSIVDLLELDLSKQIKSSYRNLLMAK